MLPPGRSLPRCDVLVAHQVEKAKRSRTKVRKSQRVLQVRPGGSEGRENPEVHEKEKVDEGDKVSPGHPLSKRI